MAPQSPLSGQSALVTGASRGIGFAIVRRLGQMGARIAMCARDPKRLEEACANLRREGIETLALPADVSRAAEVSAIAEAASKAFGAIDILVNNAGIGRFAPIHEFTEA